MDLRKVKVEPTEIRHLNAIPKISRNKKQKVIYRKRVQHKCKYPLSIQCLGCEAPEYNKCIFCLDKTERGGSNKTRKRCLERTCRPGGRNVAADNKDESPERNISTHVKYFCPKCPYKGNSKSYFRNHTKSVHDRKSFSCDMCDYSAPFSSGLSRHKKRKH